MKSLASSIWIHSQALLITVMATDNMQIMYQGLFWMFHSYYLSELHTILENHRHSHFRWGNRGSNAMLKVQEEPECSVASTWSRSSYRLHSLLLKLRLGLRTSCLLTGFACLHHIPIFMKPILYQLPDTFLKALSQGQYMPTQKLQLQNRDQVPKSSLLFQIWTSHSFPHFSFSFPLCSSQTSAFLFLQMPALH